MSIQGKGNLSYKKQNVQKQNAPHTGVKNITFAHLFSNAGETTIPFDALVTPPEWSTSGLVNPTSQSLLSAQLQVFKNNVTVTSSARGLIQKSEYIVHGNRIEFKNITSLVNEYFEVEVADILITGNLIVDMQTIRVEGELQDTETDFNMGYEFDVLNEEIIVFRDGIQMFRSDNNDSSGTTGNYYYVDTDGDGRSSLLRFFEPSVGVESVLIASTGGVVDNANVSTFQQIEHLAGQLDAIVPTVAALAGVPESNFRAGPNSVDLKTFGDVVYQNKQDINTKQDAFERKWQKKVITSPINFTGNVSELTFNSLELGKYYRITLQLHHFNSLNQSTTLQMINDGNVILQSERDPDSTVSSRQTWGTSGIFKATDTVLNAQCLNASANGFIEVSQTFAILEELPNHEETTQWT